jgi:hypothetical protein
MTENHGVPGSNPGPATFFFHHFAGKIHGISAGCTLALSPMEATWQQPIENSWAPSGVASEGFPNVEGSG